MLVNEIAMNSNQILATFFSSSSPFSTVSVFISFVWSYPLDTIIRVHPMIKEFTEHRCGLCMGAITRVRPNEKCANMKNFSREWYEWDYFADWNSCLVVEEKKEEKKTVEKDNGDEKKTCTKSPLALN